MQRKITKLRCWGVTVFDSLDTMLLMDLHDEFNHALSLVERTTFSMDEVGSILELFVSLGDNTTGNRMQLCPCLRLLSDIWEACYLLMQ